MNTKPLSYTAHIFWILFVLPAVFILAYSFSGSWHYPNLFPDSFTANHWRSLFGSQSGLLYSVYTSLSMALLVASTSTVLGFMSSRIPKLIGSSSNTSFLLFLPFVLAPVIYAATVYFIFVRLSLTGSFLGVYAAQFLITYPYSIIILSGFWTHRQAQMQLLSASLGASRRQQFIRVTMPAAKHFLLLSFFQTFLISWFEFGLTTFIGVGKVQTLTLKVFQFITEANTFLAAVASALLVIPPLILLLMNKNFIHKKYS